MKGLASIILSGAILTTAFVGASTTAHAFSKVCEVNENGYLFNTFDDGTAEFLGYEGSDTKVVIPATINDCTVTSISHAALASDTNITSVTIPDTVTFIDIGAFHGCTNLANITIPNSVTNIRCDFDDTAYYNDSNNWEDDALYIGNHLIATKTTMADEYKVKDGTITISSSAFEYCTDLEEITIPESVKTINCGFEDTAYYYNSANWEDGALYLNNHLIGTDAWIAEDYKIKDGTVSISAKALSSFSIKKITIPASVSVINSDTLLYSSNSLEEINVVEENEYYHSIDGVLIDSKTNTLLKYPAAKLQEDYTIPEGIKIINEPAFYNCTFKSLTLPSSVEKLIRPEQFFYSPLHTWNVEEINVSEDSKQFYSSDGILFDKQSNKLVKYPSAKSDTEYIIPDNVTGIEDYAFYGSNLKKVTVPSSVTIIGSCAFKLSNDLKDLTILNPNCTIYLSSFPTNKNIKIRSYQNSTAKSVADDQDLKFVALDKASNSTGNKLGFSSVVKALDTPVVKVLLVAVLILLILLLIIKKLTSKKRKDENFIDTKPINTEPINTEITLDSLNL